MNSLWLPFTVAFRSGVAFREAGYRHGWFKTRRLARPVVSVGNLTTGGTGKTPLVACVAKCLLRRGWKPGILTRGYGRSGKETMIALAPGASRRANAQELGDEPALLARLLPEVPLLVGADRFRCGQAAEAQFQVDVHILDDGFQHLRLGRDLDVVALDATQTLSDWGLLPAGRQREPLCSLRRAQIVVVTRTDSASSQSLEALVAKTNPAARLFRCRTELSGWSNALSGEAVPHEIVRAQKVAAFCGIGNPQAFFGDLRRWGLSLVAEDAFPDHQVYTGKEIQQLVRNAGKKGATALVTTQKDAVKFSQEWLPQLPILASEIEARILEAADFERTLLLHLEKFR